MTTRLAHLSDPHFGSESLELASALADHLANGDYDLVIVSGDLTMAARSREFAAAKSFLAATGRPVLAVPGNHDVTPYRLDERFLAPWRRWHTHVAAELEPTWSNEATAIVGVNTARRALLKLDWSRGSISPRQIQRLRRRLAPVPPSRYRIVVAHHPFLPDAATDRLVPLVGRAETALRAFADCRVDLILSGHLHRTYTAVFSAPGAAGADVAPGIDATHPDNYAPEERPVVVQAGTALSGRTRGEANAFNSIEIARDGALSVRRVVWQAGGWRADPDPILRLTRPWATDAPPPSSAAA